MPSATKGELAWGTHICSCNDGSISVRVGKKTLSLSPGRAFTIGSTSWTPMTAGFKGPRNDKPTLKIQNAAPGAQIIVIDNVVVAAE